jgi:hypothetical protein
MKKIIFIFASAFISASAFSTTLPTFDDSNPCQPAQSDPKIKITRTGGTKHEGGPTTYKTVNSMQTATVWTLECRGAGEEICGFVTTGITTSPNTEEYDIQKGLEVADQLYSEYIACSQQFEKEAVLSIQDEASLRVYKAVLVEKEIGSVEIYVYINRI